MGPHPWGTKNATKLAWIKYNTLYFLKILITLIITYIFAKYSLYLKLKF